MRYPTRSRSLSGISSARSGRKSVRELNPAIDAPLRHRDDAKPAPLARRHQRPIVLEAEHLPGCELQCSARLIGAGSIALRGREAPWVDSGRPLTSAALMSPTARNFVAAVEDFAAQHEIPLAQFEKGQRKDTAMAEHLRSLCQCGRSGVSWQGPGE
jgi:hypothetical protein